MKQFTVTIAETGPEYTEVGDAFGVAAVINGDGGVHVTDFFVKNRNGQGISGIPSGDFGLLAEHAAGILGYPTPAPAKPAKKPTKATPAKPAPAKKAAVAKTADPVKLIRSKLAEANEPIRPAAKAKATPARVRRESPADFAEKYGELKGDTSALATHYGVPERTTRSWKATLERKQK